MELLFYIILFILSYILFGASCTGSTLTYIYGTIIDLTMTPTTGPLNGSTMITWSSTRHEISNIYILNDNYVLDTPNTLFGTFTMPPWQPSFENLNINIVFVPANINYNDKNFLFTYLAPTISLNPNDANYQNTTSVVITGDNYANDFNGTGVIVNIYLNSNFTNPLPITSTSKKTVTFTMPSGEPNTTATITLEVKCNNVTDTATATFSYI